MKLPYRKPFDRLRAVSFVETAPPFGAGSFTLKGGNI
jgi:hypothetical protein